MRTRVLFHGYPQDPEAHPERPWWRWISSTTLARSDGRTLIPPEAWTVEEIGDALATIDAQHPLPVPPPLASQVWVFPHNVGEHRKWPLQKTVTSIALDTVFWDYGRQQEGTPDGSWPPAGGVLAYGPLSPWAPSVLAPCEEPELEDL